METLSQLQARLSPIQRDGRTFDVGLSYLAELFSALFIEEYGEAEFQAGPGDLRGILEQLLVIGSMLKIDVGIAVRRKYRNQCPRCFQKPCTCWNAPLRPMYRRRGGRLLKERTIAEMQGMLNEVFPHRHTLAEEVQHVREEIAELIEALDSRDKEATEEEIADVFAWLARVANTLGISLDAQRPL